MRILGIPREDRYRRVQLHVKRDKPSSYARRRAARPYSVVMQRARGNAEGPTQEQLEFAQWVKDVVDAFGDPPRKWSLSRLARESGVHRNNIYEWMNAKSYPQAETVKRFCDNLGIDYAEPARILGWSDRAAPTPKNPERYIRQARKLIEHAGTSERRRKELEAGIRMVESTLRSQQEAERARREAEALLRAALEEIEDADL